VSGTFVGRISGTDIFITVVTNGTDVRAYVCDGEPASEVTVAEWFKGISTDNSLDLLSASGAARLEATFRPDAVMGSLELPARAPIEFTASVAGAISGLYAYKNIHSGEQYQAGWIVLPSGELRGSLTDPTRTSIGVTLNVTTGTAQLPGIGTVTTGRVTSSNLTGFQSGGWPP
jgi:hypothetical protein